MELLWCSTDENPADLLTKAITSSVKFQKFAKMLMGHQDSVVVAFVRCSVVAAVRGQGLMVVCGGSDCGVLPTVTFLGVRDVVCLRCGCEDWS